MKDKIIQILQKNTNLTKEQLEAAIEIPKDSTNGDYAFPCFILAKEMKKNPAEIAKELANKIDAKGFEKIQAIGPYLNFCIDRSQLAKNTLKEITSQKDRYGSSKKKNKTIIIECSSPNIAKPFGIGHLRSTIIGNALAHISSFLGYNVKKINYLGDWGTPFAKIIAGFQDFGSEAAFKKDPVKHLYEIYLRVSKDPLYEEKGKQLFKELEQGDKQLMKLWKRFKAASIQEFEQIYKKLNVQFDVISGESTYTSHIPEVVKQLQEKKLLKKSEGAELIDLEQYHLGVSLIKKSDGSTLYITRDIAAALDRYKKYHFDAMLYEVGAEQKLHFKQLFKVLELLGHDWAEKCSHIDHGLYLDTDGKKFATRKGKTIFMEDILNETEQLAKQEIQRREKLAKKELETRAAAIALAAIVYGDLKNYRSHDMVFDIDRFISFEGDTGPYLLYTYARAKSILKKASKTKSQKKNYPISEKEKQLIHQLAQFPNVVKESWENYAPNRIAQYAFTLAQSFNEFYHSEKVIGSDTEFFKLQLVQATAQVLKNALFLLGIPVLEKM